MCVLGGGVPYCPWWGGPWGEHGVCPFDEPLRAGVVAVAAIT